MPCTNEDLRRYIEMFFEDESQHHEDVHEVEYRRGKALEAFDALVSRETELLARIQQLEDRAAQAAELVTKAVEIMDTTDPRQTMHLASGNRLDAIGATEGIDLPRHAAEPDYDYRNRLLARLHEWRSPAHDGPTGAPEERK